MLPTLYSFRRCPYAMRARLALRVSGTSVVLREVVLRDKPAALIALSPKATVPVLQLPGGRVLEQSLDIMRWALSQHDPEGWMQVTEHDEVQAIVALNDGPFKQALDRYKYAPRHPQRPPEQWRDEAVEAMLAPLEARLARHRWLLRDTPSLADMAVLPFVRQFAGVDADWFAQAPLPRLRAWLHDWAASPLLDSVMHKYPAWRVGDEDTRF
ncbi:glutathione S-transferase [Xylophilus sp. GOD-11R]|uniref:glutathione S-transferase n=1 Tax=Xylophilus sp. GOD-11R TaxID=3089814 RepID=UPI00298CF2AE|nr:glutathione S-transferase [Xylophilus sp. GOD-11R]WPB55763.1 glutathione S-transferase [Xylophilus sp. GOD-11R]